MRVKLRPGMVRWVCGVGLLAAMGAGRAIPAAVRDAPVRLRCAWRADPIGISSPHPRLTWAPPRQYSFIRETAWQVEVGRSAADLRHGRALLWNSGQRPALRHYFARYGGPALASFTRYFWRVRVWNQNLVPSPWSKVADWMTGPMTRHDWRGQWISYTHKIHNPVYQGSSFPTLGGAAWIQIAGSGNGQTVAPGLYTLFKKFTLPAGASVTKAILICAADDQARVALNGTVLNKQFDCRFTHPAVFKVTKRLKPGTNHIGVLLRNWGGAPNPSGFIATLQVHLAGGAVLKVVTDHSWRAVAGQQANWRTGVARPGTPPAHVVAVYGQGPWGRPRPSGAPVVWLQKVPSPIFRKVFTISGGIKHAYCFISGLGFFQLKLNSRQVSHDVLTPTFFDYEKEVPFISYNVAKYLHSGANVVTLALGNGWFNECEADAWHFNQAPWRARPEVLMNLLVEKADGTRQWVATNASWSAADGPRLVDGVRTGEVYDAALRIKGWNQASFRGQSLARAQVVPGPRGRLTSQMVEPSRVMRVFKPVWIRPAPGGAWVAKFPDNIAGWVTLTARGSAGKPIVLRYAERRHADGWVDQGPIKGLVFTGAFQTDTYIPDQARPFTWHPEFTYHGFQYVQINGLSHRRDLLDLRADMIHTPSKKIGRFSCANHLLNKIARITSRTYENNFADGFPTDCPTREKCGWMGDGWLAAAQGMAIYRNAPAYEQWVQDMANWQQANGNLYCVIPNSNGWGGGNLPDWDSACIIVPWYVYLYDGDGSILAAHYAGMKRFFQFIASTAPSGIMHAGQGDWCSPAVHPAPRAVTSTALFYYDACLLRRMAARLGHRRSEDYFSRMAARIKAAFQRKFYRGRGVYANGGQTAQAVALYYHLVPRSRQGLVVRQLVNDIRADQNHLDVGVLGCKALFRALSRAGRQGVVYDMLTQTTYPGYGFWIAHGASTLWENWSTSAGSLDHIMFGDVAGWFYNYLAGIAPVASQPGFRSILFYPRPVRRLAWAQASIASHWGGICSAWRWAGGRLVWTIRIPPGASGHLIFPGSAGRPIRGQGPNIGRFSVCQNGDQQLAVLGPGVYRFSYTPGPGRLR